MATATTAAWAGWAAWGCDGPVGRLMRLGLGQVNATVGDFGGNAHRVLQMWDSAAAAGCDLVVFPELALTGALLYDLPRLGDTPSRVAKALRWLARRGPADTPALVGTIAEGGSADAARAPRDTTLYNCAVLLTGGTTSARFPKTVLRLGGASPEVGLFRPGRVSDVVSFDGVRAGVLFGADLLEVAVDGLRRRGATLLLVPTATPFQRGAAAPREARLTDVARTHGLHLAWVNLAGGQDEWVLEGHSAVVGPAGTVARAAAFREQLMVVDVPVGHRDDRSDAATTTTAPASAAVPVAVADDPSQALPNPPNDVAQVWDAVVAATADYCRKSRFDTAVVGLSGGIDSSVVAAIAVDALGADAVLGVSMPSPHSSDHSLQDAAELAQNLGCRHETIPIEPGMRAYETMLAELFADLPADITEENLQARIRGHLLMAVSNKLGHVVLATGNKSEAAVGYATLYGDMAGGFAPLADVSKGLVYQLAHHRNRDRVVIPERVLTKPPSAELRPGQRDSDTLPDYAVLDPIVEGHLAGRLTAQLIDAGHPAPAVEQVVRLIHAGEFKRRQGPPGPAITSTALGVHRRLPVAGRGPLVR